jgi:hypothetical protein
VSSVEQRLVNDQIEHRLDVDLYHFLYCMNRIRVHVYTYQNRVWTGCQARL